MHLRKTLLKSGDQVEKILKRQIGMQATDDVKLRHRFGVPGSSGFESFLQSHRVCAGSILLSSKRAQAAGGDTDVCRIDVAVHVEECRIAPHLLAHVVREPSHSQNVR